MLTWKPDLWGDLKWSEASRYDGAKTNVKSGNVHQSALLIHSAVLMGKLAFFYGGGGAGAVWDGGATSSPDAPVSIIGLHQWMCCSAESIQIWFFWKQRAENRPSLLIQPVYKWRRGSGGLTDVIKAANQRHFRTKSPFMSQCVMESEQECVFGALRTTVDAVLMRWSD